MGATVEQRAWKALAAIEDFDEGASIFSGDDRDRAYFVNGTQVANIAEGGIALRLTRKVISAHRPSNGAGSSTDRRRRRT